MSTRANVVVKNSWGDLWFYRHSDGYPEGAMPTLQKFINWIRTGRIRDNAGQAGGWLIIIGAEEYGYKPEPTESGFSGWKVGAYEPTSSVHGDIEYLYIIDLDTKTIKCHEKWDEKTGEPIGEPLFTDSEAEPWEYKPEDE